MCLGDHDSSVTAKETCRAWIRVEVFTIYKDTRWCVLPDPTKAPQRSWLKDKLNLTPSLLPHCYNLKSQFHQIMSLLSKPLAATEHFEK